MIRTEEDCKVIFKQILVLAVSDNADNATSILNSTVPGLSTTDSQEWTGTVGGTEVRAYIKYPGCDIHRKSPDFCDFLIFSIPEKHEKEEDVLNYCCNRLDARHRFLVDTNQGRKVAKNIEIVDAGAISGHLENYGKDLAEFMKEGPNLEERRKFAYGDNFEKFHKFFKTYSKFRFRIFRYFSKLFGSFDMEANKGESLNKGALKFIPQNKTSNGVGFEIDIFMGEEFKKNNQVLPFVVRDNIVSFCLELKAKDEQSVDELLNTFEAVREMADQMGLLQMLDQTGLSLSFSKEKDSAFVDFTFGGILGEGLVNQIRELNLEKFKLSWKDTGRVQTDLNLKEIYEEPNVENIIGKLSTLSIVGEGEVFNIKHFLHLIRECCKIGDEDGEAMDDEDQKKFIMVSFGLLILSTFENLEFNFEYDSEGLRDAIIDILKSFGDSYDQKKESLLTNFKEEILPMVLGAIEMIKPMIEPFKGGIGATNWDQISVEVLVPAVELEFKGTVFLPGLTEFVTNKVLN